MHTGKRRVVKEFTQIRHGGILSHHCLRTSWSSRSTSSGT
jgi:hypothetical protein